MSWRPRFLAMTSKDAEPGQSSAPYPAVGITVLALIVGVGTNLLLGFADIDFARRELIGSDGYTRYARILDLLQGHNEWFDGWIHWSNSPFGHSMHWTRPLDVLVIAFASPLAPFMGWNDAVYWIGIASGPLSHAGMILLTIWVARAFMSPQAAAIAGFIVGMQPLILGYSLVGRLDHHILISALSLATLGSTLRAFDNHRRAATWAGVLAALTMWVSTEAVVPVGLSIASLIIVWVMQGIGLTGITSWSRAFTVTIGLAILAERGPGDLTAVEYDRISLPYLMVGAAVWIGVVLIARVEYSQSDLGSRPGSRLACLVGAMGTPVVAVLLWFPGLGRGPFADTPTLVWDIWLSRVAETQPIWSGPDSIGSVLLRLTVPIAGLLCALALARRQTAHTTVWWIVAVWLVVMILLAAISIRLALYPESLAGLPMAAMVWEMILRRASGPSVNHTLIRLTLVMVAVVGHIVLSLSASLVAKDDTFQIEVTADECDSTSLEGPIEASVPMDGSILANIDIGPALHVGTGREVIVTPHHRNVEGIIDAYTIMVSPADEALRRIERRGIDAIVICPSADAIYLDPLPTDSLYEQLLSDDPPPWLTEVDTGNISSRLFVVGS